MKSATGLRPGLPDLHCACAEVRRAARLITQLYAEELREHLEPSQFALLTFPDNRSGASQTAMGKVMAFDKTTLSRNLKLMQNNGWIEPAEKQDGRAHGFRLTPVGEALLSVSKPRWKKAQGRLRSAMSEEDWDAMWISFRAITSAAHVALGG